MLPDYSMFMIARQKHAEQIKKAEYQRLIRSIESDSIILSHLNVIVQKGTPVKQFVAFFIALAVLAVVLTGCGGSEASADARPEKETSGEVAVSVSQLPAEASAPANTPVAAAPTNTPAPTTAPTETPAPTATALPQEPVVTQLSGYLTAGTFHVVGTVFNNTDTALSEVELAVVAKDAEGKTLLADFFGEAAEQALFAPEVATIQPGQTVPFGYILSAEAEPATYEVTVHTYVKAEAQTAVVEVEQGQLVKGGWGSLYLVGELVNTAATPVEITGLQGAVFGPDEQIIDVGTSLINGLYLAPAGDANGQDRAPVRIQIDSSSGLLDSVETWGIYPAATAVEARPAHNLALSEPAIYEDEAGGMHLVGTVTNNEQTPLTVYLIGGLYAADGTVVDADFNDVPFYALAPGQTLPFELSDFDAASSGIEGQVEVDHARIIVDALATVTSDTPVVTVATQNDTHENSGSFWNIKGEVVNTSDQMLSGATVIVALYDAQDRVVATQYAYAYPAADAIEPQGVAPYEVSIYASPDLDPATITIKTFVEGRIQ